ncbi:membrane fusion protein, adhesin transport system [uncultured Gammaproteobacteria bacterium]
MNRPSSPGTASPIPGTGPIPTPGAAPAGRTDSVWISTPTLAAAGGQGADARSSGGSPGGYAVVSKVALSAASTGFTSVIPRQTMRTATSFKSAPAVANGPAVPVPASITAPATVVPTKGPAEGPGGKPPSGSGSSGSGPTGSYPIGKSAVIPKVVRSHRPLGLENMTGDRGTAALVHGAVALTLISLVCFIGWTMATVVDEVAVSQGEIAPSGSVQVAQHLEGGIVAQIMVVDGQLVDAGTPLVRFDGAVAEAEKGRLLAQQLSLRLQVERLRAFTEEREPVWSPVPDERRTILEDHIRLLGAENEARRTQLSVLDRQIAAKEAELNSTVNSQEALRKQVILLAEELGVREDLFRRELNSRLPVLSSKLQLSTTEADLKRMRGSEETLSKEINALRERQVDVRAQLRRESLDKLGTAMNELSQVTETLQALRDRVSRLVVFAPVHGLVQNLPFKTLGAVVQPGGVVAEIVPVGKDLIAETRVSTRDIGFVAIDQVAKVKVSTFDYTRYGAIPATVQSISATTFLDEQRQPYYKVRLVLSRNHIERNGIRYLLLPGMTVSADIATGRKTVFEYILKPIYATVNTAFRER